MKKEILKLSSVSKIYNLGGQKIKAVDNVDLTIHQGEFISIVGKSGSGKSTLMHLMGLLDTPSKGKIYIEGKEASTLKEAELAKLRNEYIGFVFQQFNLLARTTSVDNVALPLTYSKVPVNKRKQIAIDLLTKLGMIDRLYNHSNELSGGQRQRVAIARALANDPSIVFADEPTGNLDSKTGKEVLDIFKDLHKQGKTIVLVTHDIGIAKVAKRVITIKDGKIISDKN